MLGIDPVLAERQRHLHRVITRLGQFGPLDPEAVKAFPELAQFEHFGPTEAELIGARNVFPYCGGADWICAAKSTGCLPAPA